MKNKSLYLLALLNFVLVVLVAPVQMLSNSYSDIHRNSSMVVDTNYMEIPTTLNKRDSRFVLYVFKPITPYAFISIDKYDVVLLFNCLLEFLIIFSVLVLYPVGENAPPLYN
ncbi:MAG: hypothetical protein IKM20_05610 [Erysipelotrichales bacterium]|nr:hypothetical protein [Erysipelotrichales bacterium]